MFLKRTYLNKAAVMAMVFVASMAGWAQSDTVKAYSGIGVARGETLRVGVANVGAAVGVPPGPCNVTIGITDASGNMLKSNNVTIPPGQTAFLALSFSEAAAALTSANVPARVNLRPVVATAQPVDNLLAPPCRTASSAEVFDAFLGRTHVFAVPAEGGSQTAPAAPVFGAVGVTALDTLRLNVTNITGSNGAPPDPCNVQMGFIDAQGAILKTSNVSIDPGHTATLTITYRDASSATNLTNAPVRFNLRPLVAAPPDPCRIVGSAELLDTTTSITLTFLLPAIQSNVAPAGVVLTGAGQ